MFIPELANETAAKSEEDDAIHSFSTRPSMDSADLETPTYSPDISIAGLATEAAVNSEPVEDVTVHNSPKAPISSTDISIVGLATESAAKSEPAEDVTAHNSPTRPSMDSVDLKSLSRMDSADLRSLSSKDDGKVIFFYANVHNTRAQDADTALLVLRHGFKTVQCLLTATADATISKETVKFASNINLDSIVLVGGTVKKVAKLIKSITIPDVEIHISDFRLISEAPVQSSCGSAHHSRICGANGEKGWKLPFKDREEIAKKVHIPEDILLKILEIEKKSGWIFSKRMQKKISRMIGVRDFDMIYSAIESNLEQRFFAIEGYGDKSF